MRARAPAGRWPCATAASIDVSLPWLGDPEREQRQQRRRRADDESRKNEAAHLRPRVVLVAAPPLTPAGVIGNVGPRFPAGVFAALCLRRGDRTAPRTVAGTRTARHRPPRGRTQLRRTVSSGQIVDSGRRTEPQAPAIEASGVRMPARIYDLRSTFASNALAAGITVFELARVIGWSVEMIESSNTARCSTDREPTWPLALLCSRPSRSGLRLSRSPKRSRRLGRRSGPRNRARTPRIRGRADVAQSVERRLPKPKVAGSRPVVRSHGLA